MQAEPLLLKNLNSEPAFKIGIDLMGSERSPQILFDAVIEAAKYLGPKACLTAFLSQEAWAHLSDSQKNFDSQESSKITFHFTEEVIEMADEPLMAIRHKKNSSLVIGIKMLKKKALDAFISPGNTGALIVSSALTLSLLPGIKRPALLASLPTSSGHISVLDVGGSVSCKAKQLLSFAIMGACFEKVHYGVKVPKVGLLNVGSESKKGTLEHRNAYQMLQALKVEKDQIEFIGNVEGFEVFEGKADVLVTDGFTGNVFLKTAEGIAAHILHYLKKTGSTSELKNLSALFSSEKHPGAILLGVEGVVVKCHGGSTPEALFSGIKAAASYVEKGLIEKMKASLFSLLT